MPIQDVWIKKIGTHRGSPRVYLDGLQAVRTGFAPGERFNVEVDGKRVVITRRADGSRVVSSKRKGDVDRPVIDINSTELLSMFEGMDAIRVVVGPKGVYLLPLASEARKIERTERLTSKLRAGEPLAAGSLAHGGGVLAHAIHAGLRDAGIRCDLKFANELRDDLLLQASEHNDSWSVATAALGLPMQEMAQDEWLLSQLPKLDVLEMGLPCSGASLAGHTKNKLSKMEDHAEVGHLVYSALVIISKTNPSVVLLENVPRYADTASAQILRHQFRDMGYDTHEAILDGADYGCLEGRVRWCMVAVSRGIDFSFDGLKPTVTVVRTVADVIDRGIGPDDERWREVPYLKAKRARNELEGNGFRMQYVVEASTKVPTIRRGYSKGGSTDPRLRHPTDPNKSRLFTATEVASIKGIEPELVAGLPQTTALALMGQSIVYEPFRAAGQRIGERLRDLVEPARHEMSAEDDQDEQRSGVSLRRQRHTG